MFAVGNLKPLQMYTRITQQDLDYNRRYWGNDSAARRLKELQKWQDSELETPSDPPPSYQAATSSSGNKPMAGALLGSAISAGGSIFGNTISGIISGEYGRSAQKRQLEFDREQAQQQFELQQKKQQLAQRKQQLAEKSLSYIDRDYESARMLGLASPMQLGGSSAYEGVYRAGSRPEIGMRTPFSSPYRA
uniref:Putative capsid protein n=1 Tax=PNG bee virus 1 TaxID=2746864 RepID=A0A7D5BXL3_9CALI|nr:putative capsid protein [PNG bee virus 1]